VTKYFRTLDIPHALDFRWITIATLHPCYNSRTVENKAPSKETPSASKKPHFLRGTLYSSGWLAGWMDGLMDGWLDGWMAG